MGNQIRSKIRDLFPDIKMDVALAPYLNFGVGGRAAFLLEIDNSDDLVAAVIKAKKNKLDYVIVAGGSNVFFADGKINKLVIIYRKVKSSTKDFKIKGEIIECDAAVSLADVIRVANKNGLAGLESMAGIPGTIGGAVFGHAGAYGQWISGVVWAVEILDHKLGRKWIAKRECGFGHKTSVFKNKNLIILTVRLKFKKGNPEELKRKSKEITIIRWNKFKDIIYRCPGSFFKNILKENVPKKAWPLLKDCRIINGELPAGYLLEQVGGCGMKAGKIQVADFHGNLIINNGGGKARDVWKLAKKLKDLVYKKYGIKLEEEVRYIS